MYARIIHLTVCAIVLAAVPRLYAAYPETEPRPRPIASSAERYRETAERIIRETLKQNDAWNKMEELCDGIGHRLSGSRGLEQAIDWAVAALQRDGQENVRKQKVMVPHWVRGTESAAMLEPYDYALSMLGLGGSVGTAPEGITAPVLVVADEKELDAAGDKAQGKIVLFNNPMPLYDPLKGSGYGTAVRFRHRGAQLAAAKGAVACLVRSVTANSLRTPHTGAMSYGDVTNKIPAAAIAIEDAELLARLQRRGTTPVVNLKMSARTLPDAESANVIAELRGREKPEEIVVIGGHIDAWDVGQGAHDDAGGCVISMEAVNVLRRLNLIPRRTIRVVLWTNEENGLRGGKAYAAEHAAEMDNHVAAIESDGGVFRPTGFSLECADKDRETAAAQQLQDIVNLLKILGPMNADVGGSGADISPMKPAGVVLIGHSTDGSHYFDHHHAPSDTLDKVDPTELSQNVAAMAVVAYVLADMEERLGDRPPADTATR